MRKAIISILLIPLLLLGQQPQPATPAAADPAAQDQTAQDQATQDAAQPQAQPADQQDPADAPPADASPDPQAAQPDADPQEPAPAPPPAPDPNQPPPELEANGSERVRFSNLRQADLLEVVDLIANTLKMNYILDPALRSGTVSINTYGDLTRDDLFPLLETILRMNGASAVKIGEFYRISPSGEIPRLPISPQTDPDASIPDDERMILNVIRFRYTTATDIAAVLEPFVGPGALV